MHPNIEEKCLRSQVLRLHSSELAWKDEDCVTHYRNYSTFSNYISTEFSVSNKHKTTLKRLNIHVSIFLKKLKSAKLFTSRSRILYDFERVFSLLFSKIPFSKIEYFPQDGPRNSEYADILTQTVFKFVKKENIKRTIS